MAKASIRKVALAVISTFRKNHFDASRCKTEAKMATSRIKLLRNKREAQVREMRRELAMLLESGKEETARIRVEHVIREQSILAANDIIELFCELIVVRLNIIAKQSVCPADLKEGISSLIFAAPRCSEIPELARLSVIFEKKYGKDFVAAAAELRRDSGVNHQLIEKLAIKKPSGEVKIKVLKDIAKEYQVDWDVEGAETNSPMATEEYTNNVQLMQSKFEATSYLTSTLPYENIQPNATSSKRSGEATNFEFKDSASAARAAAESADRAAAAAEAAARLARQSCSLDTTSFETCVENHSTSKRRQSMNSSVQSPTTDLSGKHEGTFSESQSFIGSNYREDDEIDGADSQSRRIRGRDRSAVRNDRVNIKFDDSDASESDEDTRGRSVQSQGPPHRLPPKLPPPGDYVDNLPDNSTSDVPQSDSSTCSHQKRQKFDDLTARFEALRRSHGS